MRPGGEDGARGGAFYAEEQQVLRAFCRSICDQSRRWAAKDFEPLTSYRFRNPSHQLVFDALKELRAQAVRGRAISLTELQKWLIEWLTRKGFPDVEIEPLLEPPHLSVQEIREVILRLTTAAKREK